MIEKFENTSKKLWKPSEINLLGFDILKYLESLELQ